MSTINRESFDALLEWLDPDREVAAEQYEIVQAGLIRIFVSKGFVDAEDLADEVINTVIVRLPEIRDGYVGDKARYFHGVARYKILEQRRRKEVLTDDFPERGTEFQIVTDDLECLRRCLKFLTGERQALILDYHVYKGRDKIEQHRQMAIELAITENALRGQAHHIRVNLEKCVRTCTAGLRQTQKATEGS